MAARHLTTRTLLSALGGLLLTPATASAVEVQFEGFYRARARMFDTLSLDRELENSEGYTGYVEHRFWLRPKLLVSDQVGVFADIRGLDNVAWGDQPTTWTDPSTGEDVSGVFTDSLTAPTSEDDGSVALLDLSLWRVWSEIHTPIGRFRVGRVPLHWGNGIWLNDGLGSWSDYGDSADRLEYQGLFGPVWIMAAAEINASGFINQEDDTNAYSLAISYRDERISGGLYAQYRSKPSDDLDLFIVDAMLDIELGPVKVSAEGVGFFGSGNLDNDVNDITITAVGAVLEASLDLDRVVLGLEGGVATGDDDFDDGDIKVFSFDRDYQVGLLMFEQSMPVLQSAVNTESNGGRNTDYVLTGNGVQNAMYFRPTITVPVYEGLWVRASALGAATAALPDEDEYADRSGYGWEIDGSIGFDGIEHLELSGTFGVFFPGGYYKNFEDENISATFDDEVFGGQLLMRVRF